MTPTREWRFVFGYVVYGRAGACPACVLAEARRRLAALRAMPYAEYLRSPEWRERRQVALEAAGHRCQVCNAPGPLDVHHRTYERLGAEDAGDLFVLCRTCHDLFHRNGRLAREAAP